MDRFQQNPLYKNSKSKNLEVHLLRIHGRITRRAFIIRSLFAIMIQLIAMVIQCRLINNKNDITNPINSLTENDKTFLDFSSFNFVNFYLPIFFFIFIIIQAVKRIHDVNKSGWYVLAPFYNIYLLFEEGSAANNSFGINPRPQQHITFFDELK